MRRHLVVKPYQCGVCKKEYTQKGALEVSTGQMKTEKIK